jgi:hypothetical protein
MENLSFPTAITVCSLPSSKGLIPLAIHPAIHLVIDARRLDIASGAASPC